MTFRKHSNALATLAAGSASRPPRRPTIVPAQKGGMCLRDLEHGSGRGDGERQPEEALVARPAATATRLRRRRPAERPVQCPRIGVR